MSAQTTYKFDTVRGCAGGIYDLAPYEINTFINAEADNDMAFGIGVTTYVDGDTVAHPDSIMKPTAASQPFLGVTVNNRTRENDRNGDLEILNKTAVGVMRWGRVYVRVKTGKEPKFGDAAYVLTSGTEAGFFSPTSTDGDAVQAVFGSEKDSNNVALLILKNS